MSSITQVKMSAFESEVYELEQTGVSQYESARNPSTRDFRKSLCSVASSVNLIVPLISSAFILEISSKNSCFPWKAN